MATTIKLKNSVTTTNAPSSLVQGEVAINITDKKVWVGNAATTPIQLLGAGASGTFGALTVTSLTDSGNLTFTGTGNRITGDFSNATQANRVMFQTSITNSNTSLTVIPNGTGAIGAFNAFNSSDPNNTSYGQLRASASTIDIICSQIGTGTNLPLTIQTGGSERLRIDTSGNVGIGTSSPVSGLELFRSGGQTTAAITTGTNVEPFITLRQNSAAAGAGGGVIFGAQGGSFAAIKGLLTNGGSNTTGDLAFSTRNATGDSALTERMRIDSSGNVGIGSTSPTAKLQVTGTVHATGSGSFPSTGVGIEIVPASAGGTNYIQAYNRTGSAWQNLEISSAQTTFGTGGSERMRITSGGKVQIGSSSNVNNGFLQIVNNNSDDHIQVRNPNATAGKYWAIPFLDSNNKLFIINNAGTGVSITDGGTSWGAQSDERLKDIIEPITDATNKVSQLRSVIGKYKTDNENTRRSFLIAQDVQAVLPEAVDATDPDKLCVQYTDVIPLLVAAIKEQQAMIEELKQEVALLKSK